MYDVVIENGTIVAPDAMYKANIGIHNGVIGAIVDSSTQLEAKERIDAKDKLIFPGIIDTHAHLNDPGFTWREDAEHGSAAAAVGGITTIVDMPLQNEPALSSATIFDAKQKALSGRMAVDYAFWGALVDNLDDLSGLNEKGVVAFKAFIGPVSPDYSSVNYGHIRQALKTIKKFDGLAGFHCEDFSIIKTEEALAKKEGRDTLAGFLASRPLSAEIIATQSVIELCREIGTRVHICHVSHPAVAECIRFAQEEGLPVVGETCTHYLTFTEDDVLQHGTIFKCAPPLRSAADREALWDYVLDGTLGCLGSDHSPCRADEKDIDTHGALGAWGGISGLQHVLQVLFDQGVHKRGFSPCFLARASAASADAFSLAPRKGQIAPGADADLVVLDPNASWKITPESLHYLNPISAFVGLEGKGLPVTTLVRGRVVASNGTVVAQGHGQLMLRGAH